MNAHYGSSRAALHTFGRFLCVGGSATALQYLLLMAMVGKFDVAPLIASSLAYAISTIYNYIASHAFTYRSRRAHSSALPRYVCVSAVGLGLNAAVVWISFDQLHMHYLVAQLLATVATLSWNYLAGLRWAFAT
jgi:putative flippase GtrA